MNITDVRVRKVAKEGKMKAVVSITIDDEFVVHDIKVIEGEKGLFIITNFNKLDVAFHVDEVIGIHRVSWEAIIKPDSTLNQSKECLFFEHFLLTP